MYKKINDYKKKKEIEEDKKVIEVLYNAKMNIRE
jgi:hypothetical protein